MSGDHTRPPKSPRKGKYVNIRIGFLNDTVHVFQVPVKGVGSLLWNAVVEHLHLLEADYFDLEYTNHNGDECWLDKDKAIIKQLGSADTPLRFCVKFYTPDPGLLEDELTRYLFALQVRKDLLRGELRCSENTAALLASYVVQGEIGDFDCEEYPDPTYLAVFKFVPEHLQTHEFMAKVMDYHRQHIGESPSECDLNLLDTARKVELYGVKMQNAKDHEGVSLNLAVAHLGVLVFQHFTKINTFSWAKVRKLSFKRKKFLIKLHADTYGYYKDTVEFFFDSRDRCKLFWKRCIEHHAFFRCQLVSKVPRNKTRMVSRGSSFRYCGRTQKQLVEYVRENIGKRPHFERSTSGRISSRSASVTPKISSKPGMHSSSADLHTSSGSRSSGSHILESNHTPGTRSNRDSSGAISAMRDHSGASSAMRGGVESVDVHSDSSMSGSRSLNSPRLEHGLSIDQEVIEAVNARTEGAMTDDEEESPDPTHTRHPGMAHVASETKVSAMVGHGFSHKDRKASAPAFGDLREKASEEDHRLSRTEEIENIPEVVEEDAVPSISPRHSPPKRLLMGIGRQASQRSDISEDLPPPPPSPPILSSPSPPPPPPPFEDELDQFPPPLPDPLVDEVEAMHLVSDARHNGEQDLPPEDFAPPPPQEDSSDIPISDQVLLENPSNEQQQQQQQHEQQQYLPQPPSPPQQHLQHHQDSENTAASTTAPYPPPTETEALPSGVRDSPLKVLGAGGESSTESSTLIAPPDESFSREDSLDVSNQEQDESRGDLSVADLSHKVVESNGDIDHRVVEAAARAISEASVLSGHEEEHRRKGRHRPTDTAYYIAKELLMTERTYKKDLEVLCVWFRNAVSCEPTIHTAMHELLFQYLDPIYNFHHTFLKEVEQRLAAWEGKVQPQTNGENQKIGDLMLKAINSLQEIYESYFEHLEETLTEVESKIKRQRPFEEICRGFESQKVCYLPLNTFFLRPGQRLLHFKLILERLVKHYSFTHHDTEDCKEALCQVTEIIQGAIDNFRKVENLEKLMELQRDLLGLENLVHLEREFIREGCLQKFSRKGYQQRMFFLFSDMLVYTSRTSASLLQFKVHGQLPLRGMTVEETDQSKSSVQNSFAIYAGNKYILVAASSPEEKDKWIEDINEAVQRVKQLGLDKLQYPSLKSSASSSENVGGSGENVDGDGEKEKEKPIQHRANTTMHVCWHRNTSVSMRDHDKALKNQLSGYLLRKFKTSNGWQKLWVVFTNFCLFFYKTYQDDLPLASLPLLGYAVNTPDEEDGINKDHVFKLQFKNHVYFFRAESEFTFSRWMEVINSATHNARRTRLFSRVDSRLEAS